MKKIYLLIIALAITYFGVAQVTLTKAVNQPVIGDVNSKQMYDSVGIVPKTFGTNQIWDFSNFILNSNVEVSNYISASAGGGASYSGSNLVESYGSTNFFMKATATQYEIVGIQNSNFALNISSNTAIKFLWPVAMSYSLSDGFSGTATANNTNGNVSGNITTLGCGTGTLILPGGDTHTDILLVKTSLIANASFLLGLTTVDLKVVEYTYYDAYNKFPLLTVLYADVSGAYTFKSADIKVNSAIVGINDLNFDTSFIISPNPAKNNFNVSLYNATNANCTIEIINAMGQTIQLHHLGNAVNIANNISISNLVSGMYMVKTTLGNKVSVKKLIKE